MKQMRVGLVVVAMLLAFGGSASATTFGFYCLDGQCAPDLSGQLSVTLAQNVAGTVDFTFRNNVGVASNVTEIYFSDGPAVGASYLNYSVASIAAQVGATFSLTNNLAPPDLPGGAGIGFVTDFGVDSDQKGGGSDGLNAATDSLTVRIGLLGTTTFANVISAMESGSLLRIGLHVRSIGTAGGSAAYVTNEIPEPSTYFSLLAAAMGGLFWYRRRQTRRA